jgi:hypothetical protein
MGQSIRTSVYSFLNREGVATVAFRILVAGILVLLLTQLGSVVGGLSSNFTGIVASVG